MAQDVRHSHPPLAFHKHLQRKGNLDAANTGHRSLLHSPEASGHSRNWTGPALGVLLEGRHIFLGRQRPVSYESLWA